MRIVRHSGERTHRLPLAARGDNNKILVRYPFCIEQINQHTIRDLDIAEFDRQTDDLLHAAAGNRHFAVVCRGVIDDFLDPVDV